MERCAVLADTGPGRHRWVVLQCALDLTSNGDPIVSMIVQSARRAYGAYLVDELPEPDLGVAMRFDLSAVTRAIRLGMPDPDAELGTGKRQKPEQLRNYRSEAAELVAQEVLADVYGVQFPAAPQVSKGNANQPVLGCDGWGLLELEGDVDALVLMQVKASDQDKRPPEVAGDLVDECCRVPCEPDKLARALTVMLSLLRAKEQESILLAMLEALGCGSLPRLVVCPVIVRGTVAAHLDDLATLRDARDRYEPAQARGLCVSLGAPLERFGHRVFSEARNP